MRLPSFRVGQSHGGPVPSTVRQANPANRIAFPFLDASAKHRSPGSGADDFQVTALSIEFVAKPHEAHRAQLAIPGALTGALKDVTGFAGCLVMASDQEARLLTVVTLWTGKERQKRCGENLRWVRTLLSPYLDRCLRVQTLNAHLPLGDGTDVSSVKAGHTTEAETACVA
jgi:hypothetical protein